MKEKGVKKKTITVLFLVLWPLLLFFVALLVFEFPLMFHIMSLLLVQ